MKRISSVIYLIIFIFNLNVVIQARAQFNSNNIYDTLKSTQLIDEGKVVFRIYAPHAESVTLTGDLAKGIQNKLNRDKDGVWEIIINNIDPGIYRYSFNIDGVPTIDPKSEQSIETYSLLTYTPSGDEFFALKNIPHGAITERYYYSKATNTLRRLHLWTPSGFEKQQEKLPVLYLLHGGGDNDKGWPKLGAADPILDNLYNKGKIPPMIVVMPDGQISTEVFTLDLCESIIPFIECTYNVYTDSSHRALAGLSKGGIQVMDIILEQHEKFDWYFILSSGWFKGTEDFKRNVNKLPTIVKHFNKHVKLLLFTQGGPDDIAYNNGMATLKAFREYGIKCESFESNGGHTWYTWRKNLNYLLPRLFK